MQPWEQMPLYKKAMEIQKLVDSIVDIVHESEMEFETEAEGQMIDTSLSYLIDNSMMIPSKIAGASGEDTPYDIKMENAALIRKGARELLTDARAIEDFGFKDIDYLDVLRVEIEELRILFAEWVKTFDPWNYILDDWGLFNPPGVAYDDGDDDYFDDDDDDDDFDNDEDY